MTSGSRPIPRFGGFKWIRAYSSRRERNTLGRIAIGYWRGRRIAVKLHFRQWRGMFLSCFSRGRLVGGVVGLGVGQEGWRAIQLRFIDDVDSHWALVPEDLVAQLGLPHYAALAGS